MTASTMAPKAAARAATKASGRTELLRQAASILGGGLLYGLWPWLAPADDPFRITAAVLPAVASALAWLGRDAARRTGRRAHRASWLEAALVAAVVVGLPFRHGLGWNSTGGLWAAALILALGSALRRRLLDLRPLLARDRPVTVHFFFLPLVVYLAVQPWALESRPPDGDEPYNLLLAHSLAFDLDTDLDNQYDDGDSLRFMGRRLGPQTGDPVARDGSQQSRHSALLPLLIAGPYALFGRAGAAAVMALLSAALAWQCLRLLRLRLPSAGRTSLGQRADGGAFLAWATVSFLPPLVLYAHQIWVEVPAALLLALALERALDDGAQKPGRRQRRDLELAVLLALLPLLKLRFALLSVTLLGLALWRRRGSQDGTGNEVRRLLRLATPGAVAAAALVGVWWWRYGNPLKLYTRGELATLASSPWNHARGLLGLFYDCAFGLFAAAPLWALLLPGAAWLLRTASGRRLALRIALVGFPYLLLVSPRLEWYGGWSPPFRYGLVLLPLLALPLGTALTQRRRAGVRCLLVLLGAPTLLLTLLWVAVPPWTYNLADGYSHLLQQAGLLLGADVGRFFPSLVRPRLATWVWIAASLLLIPLAMWSSNRPAVSKVRARRWAGAAGLCSLLALLTLLPLAVHRVPTSHVDVEDLWVRKRGGVGHPGPWLQRRPEAAGGWLIERGCEIEVPAVAGGARAEVELRVLRFSHGVNKLYADLLLPDGGREPVGSWQVDEEGEWRNLHLGPIAWPEGARLLLHHPGPPADTRRGVVVNWLEFRWLDADSDGGTKDGRTKDDGP